MIQHSFSTGTIVVVDLDNFKACTAKKGWTRYTPNPITALLTQKIQQIISVQFGTLLWGLNEQEGTEESLLYFSCGINEIYDTFEALRLEILALAQKEEATTSLSIGMAYGPVTSLKRATNNRCNTLQKDLTRVLAYKALYKAKKTGGNQIMI